MKWFRAPFSMLTGVIVVMLLIAYNESLPYAYYLVLRTFVFLASAFYILTLWPHRQPSTHVSKGLLGLLMANAIIYNPLIKVSMSRSDWEIVNALTIILMLVVAVYASLQMKDEAVND